MAHSLVRFPGVGHALAFQSAIINLYTTTFNQQWLTIHINIHQPSSQSLSDVNHHELNQ